MDNSLKGGERATRIAAAGGIIRLARIRSDTKVPEQMPNFWVCSANKEKFQSFVTSHVLDFARKIKISIIFSGTVVEMSLNQHSILMNWVMYNKSIS